MISVLKSTCWELPLNCKHGVQIRTMNIDSYGKGPSISAVSLSPPFFQNKERALSVRCLYVHIMGKIAQVEYLWFYVQEWAVTWGTNMSKYGNFLLLFLFVPSVIVNFYYTVTYTASTCVQFLTLIKIFFPA